METIEYRTQDKSTWGAGPWQDEPDKMQYADTLTGMPCVIRRTGHGHLCGYVGVPPSHPYHGKRFEDVRNLKAHGDINFASPCEVDQPPEYAVCHIAAEGEEDHLWWFGFDCGHAWDVSPAPTPLHQLFTVFEDFVMPSEMPRRYRDIPYVKAQIASLAQQLKALES